MRSSSEASSPPWPLRILRPWLVASAAGLSLGTLLIGLSQDQFANEGTYSPPRAAVFDGRHSSTIPDPFTSIDSSSSSPDLQGGVSDSASVLGASIDLNDPLTPVTAP